MELPHIGQHCSLKQCNQLDFLPIKCDACSLTFCSEHFRYEFHNCQTAKNKDNQVPVCPLCSKPVPSFRNNQPDFAVSQHIDLYCRANENIDHSKLSKTTNSSLQLCSFKACKQKDVIYLQCETCNKKYCIKHRNPLDHLCTEPNLSNTLAETWQTFRGTCSTNTNSGFDKIRRKAHEISKSGKAAIDRLATKSGELFAGQSSSGTQPGAVVTRTTAANYHGSLSEEEALAIAIAESKTHVSGKPISGTSQHVATGNVSSSEDEALARALHESQLEALRTNGAAAGSSTNHANDKTNCAIS